MRGHHRVAILGGKGGGTLAAQILLNIARADGSHALAGYLNDRLPKGAALHGGEVLGGFDDWRGLDPGIHFVAPLHKVGHIRENSARVLGLGIPDSRWATLIDPAANVADGVQIGRGSILATYASVWPDAIVGSHCFLRPGAIVSHDVTLGDFVYVGPNATVCGKCRIGTGVHIAPGATVRDEVTIGEYAVIGLGAVVTGDVPAYAVVTGNPARNQRSVERDDRSS